MIAAPAEILAEERDNVLWVRINRPTRRNALNRDAFTGLRRTFDAFADRPTLKAAVVTGEGDEAFAAGGDLKELGSLRGEAEIEGFFDLASGTLDRIRRFPLPVVAALNGWALGGGAELALACDFRVAASHAMLGYIQATLNISCGFGGGADLMRRLGAGRGMLCGLAAQKLGATDALAAGLIDAVAAEGEPLADRVREFLQPMLARPPQVLRAYKAIALAERLGLDADARRAIEREWFVRTWTAPEHWTAVETIARPRPEAAR